MNMHQRERDAERDNTRKRPPEAAHCKVRRKHLHERRYRSQQHAVEGALSDVGRHLVKPRRHDLVDTERDCREGKQEQHFAQRPPCEVPKAREGEGQHHQFERVSGEAAEYLHEE